MREVSPRRSSPWMGELFVLIPYSYAPSYDRPSCFLTMSTASLSTSRSGCRDLGDAAFSQLYFPAWLSTSVTRIQQNGHAIMSFLDRACVYQPRHVCPAVHQGSEKQPRFHVSHSFRSFHFYRHELEAMPNAEEARTRRGSHWTFNSKRMVCELKKVRDAGSGSLPSFDHAVADPIEQDISLERTDRIVLVEGNYLLLYDEAPWGELKDLFDERWFVACDESVLRERVIKRNAAAWGWDYERTAERVDTNDVPNARYVTGF